MVATFPSGIKSFSTKVDGGAILADHINDLQNEVVALEQFNLYNGGWIPVDENWTYLASNQVTVPAGAASIYSIGDRVKFTQSATVKYFYVVAVSDTILTLMAGTDYSVASAPITSAYYAKTASAVGFPSIFSLPTPTWTTSGVAFTNQPVATFLKFQLNNRVLRIKMRFTCHAISGGTGRFICTFPAGTIPTLVSGGAGVAVNVSTWVQGFIFCTYTSPQVFTVAKYDGTTLATNSENFAMDITVLLG